MRSSFLPTSRRALLGIAFVLPAGCASSPATPPSAPQLEVACSPDGHAEALEVKVIASAKQSIRLAGYLFTSPAVVLSPKHAKRYRLDVVVLVDDRGNRSKASLAAMNLVVGAGIPLRVISVYSITMTSTSW